MGVPSGNLLQNVHTESALIILGTAARATLFFLRSSRDHSGWEIGETIDRIDRTPASGLVSGVMHGRQLQAYRPPEVRYRPPLSIPPADSISIIMCFAGPLPSIGSCGRCGRYFAENLYSVASVSVCSLGILVEGWSPCFFKAASKVTEAADIALTPPFALHAQVDA